MLHADTTLIKDYTIGGDRGNGRFYVRKSSLFLGGFGFVQRLRENQARQSRSFLPTRIQALPVLAQHCSGSL